MAREGLRVREVSEVEGNRLLLLDVAALVLAATAAHMLLDDAQIGPILRRQAWVSWVLYVGLVVLVLLIDLALRWQTRRALAKVPARRAR